VRKIIKKSVYIGVLLSFFSAITSCEEDFTDIGSKVISNTKFNTNKYTVEITAENSPVESVSADNITIEPGEYLLGVHASTEYEKIEASIVSQIEINSSLKLVDDENVYGSDTIVVSTIDTVFVKLPYTATLDNNTSSGPEFTLNSIIGDPSKAFTVNVFQTSTYLSRLNPADPSKSNSYKSNAVFDKIGAELNDPINYQFKPNENDTIIVVKRRLSNDNLYLNETIKYTTSTTSGIPIPFAVIPLNEDAFKELFLDKYESSEFDSQEAFNNYFKGIILEAQGNEGSLISFNFRNTVTALNPSIEVYYTNTVLANGQVIDTIQKNNTFLLNGIRSAIYNMEDKTYPVNNEIKLQGAAGSEVEIDLFGADTDNNGIADKIEELRGNNWLINDASLTFYINQSVDTTAIPSRLYMYKVGTDSSLPTTGLSQIKDTYTENTFGGNLERDDNGKAEKYTFRITDYISDLLSGADDFSPKLKLKVHNFSDDPISSILFSNYNWNPKAVTLLNQDIINGDKRAVLKISYSEKNN
jgi:hypothetical protein